ADRAQQRRLPRPRHSRDHDEFARLDRQRHALERGARSTWIGVSPALDRDEAHRSIPLRSANGASATTASTAATLKVRAPAGARRSGYAWNSARPATRANRAAASTTQADARKATSWRDQGGAPPRRLPR